MTRQILLDFFEPAACWMLEKLERDEDGGLHPSLFISVCSLTPPPHSVSLTLTSVPPDDGLLLICHPGLAFGWWAVCLSGCEYVRPSRRVILSLPLILLSHTHTLRDTHPNSCFSFVQSQTVVLDSRPWRSRLISTTLLVLFRWDFLIRRAFCRPSDALFSLCPHSLQCLPPSLQEKLCYKLPSTAKNTVLQPCCACPWIWKPARNHVWKGFIASLFAVTFSILGPGWKHFNNWPLNVSQRKLE